MQFNKEHHLKLLKILSIINTKIKLKFLFKGNLLFITKLRFNEQYDPLKTNNKECIEIK